jgi:hypothetical protein
MNVRYKKIFVIFLLLLINTLSFAQLTIEFPVERAVFQRNNSNMGNVQIFGNVKQDCDRVEARLISRSSGQGVTTSWVTIDSEVAGMAYSGKIQNVGGWYRLEVRGIKDENVLFTNTIERVGIGEVFVIAGQSNAQGDGSNPNANGANDDRVNAFAPNYFNKDIDRYQNFPDFLEHISFTKVNGNTNIGPGGYTPWCYGELGDMLTSRLNVPVLFFNASHTGTSSRNWENAIRGLNIYHELVMRDIGEYLWIGPTGVPYTPLKTTIQSVNKLLGIRAILWHQGEFDNAMGFSQSQYYDNVKSVIDKTRQDINANIPWVISRASRYRGSVSPAIIAGQNMLISNMQNVFPGAETDNIQPNRPDGAHFENIIGGVMGLSQLALAWNASLTDNFFSSSNPILPEDILKLQHSCNGSTVRVSANSNHLREFHWNNGHRGNVIESNEGFYYLTARDGSGNIYRTNSINIGDVFPQVVPAISAPDGLLGCTGKTLVLNAQQSKYSVQWNTGLIANTINVGNEGSYSAQYRTSQNCYSPSSQSYNVSFVNPPSKPNLMFINGDGNECEGNAIRVAINNIQGSAILWSTGETSNEVTFNEALDDDLTVTLYSLPNCPSPVSDVVDYKFFPTPPAPVINKAGPFYLQAQNVITNETYNWSLGGNVLVAQGNEYLQLEQSGIYRVQGETIYTKNNGGELKCLSAFSEEFPVDGSSILTGFSIYPNPVSNGLLQVTSDGEKENLDVFVYDILGKEVFKTHYDTISYPRDLDLRSYNLSGKYFVLLKYGTQSKTFPIFFVK